MTTNLLHITELRLFYDEKRDQMVAVPHRNVWINLAHVIHITPATADVWADAGKHNSRWNGTPLLVTFQMINGDQFTFDRRDLTVTLGPISP